MSWISTYTDISLSNLLSRYVLGIDVKQFLDTKDPITKQTNWDRIKRKYNEDEMTENEGKYPSGGILIKAGTQLDLRVAFIKRDIPKKTIQDFYRNTAFKPFLSAQLARLFKDPTYQRLVIGEDSGEALVRTIDNSISVKIWCRALARPGSRDGGGWIDVSPFVNLVQTSVSKNSGTFNLQLAPVKGQWDSSLGWSMDGVLGYDKGNTEEDILAVSHVDVDDPKTKKHFRQINLFNTIIQENDLVYIKFERLTSGNDEQIYDMIGLVDNVIINTGSSNVDTVVLGRDLMKVFIEDGSYFFVTQFAQNIFTDDQSILSKRNRAELEAVSFSAIGYTFKPIDMILKFIFNKFSNIGWVSEEALRGYGSRALKKKYNLRDTALTRTKSEQVIDQLNKLFSEEDRKGVWRIIDLIFDPQIAKRALADNSIYRDAGSMINSIRKICQEPFVEFYGDTYGDRYSLIVRKPPFDSRGYRGLVFADYLEEKVEVTVLLEGDNFPSDRYQYSASDQKRESLISDLVIDIDEIDVITDQLSYHSEAYSWYRVIPRGLGVMDEEAEFLLAPAVPFDEYAKVFGNKSFEIEYNYAPSEFLQDSELKSEAKYAESQTFYDLQYLINSHQYLPFTRTGRIVINGDRRIKRGMFIYYTPTDEIFYVDSVTQSQILNNNVNERTTTLQVSRGMIKDYIKGKFIKFPSGEKKVSYFDIINTDIDSNASINNTEFLKNWKVDRDVFDFFVQRRQHAQ